MAGHNTVPIEHSVDWDVDDLPVSVAPFAAQADAGERLVQMQKELHDKETLIEALTAQLELACEQIDRLQRSGADRQRGGAAGLPNDVVQQHRQLVDELQRVVGQWEDLQAGLTLGRIELQISELRDFVGERLSATPSVDLSRHSPRIEHAEPYPVLREPIAPAAAVSSPPAEASAWDKMKAELLAPPTTDESSSVFNPLPDPPGLVPSASTELSEWQTAVHERDDYIATLLRRLRLAEQTPLDLLTLVTSDAPEGLLTCQELRDRLEEQCRMGEVELSLERAKLAREQLRLQQQQELIEKQLKRLGLRSLDELAATATVEASSPDRRWIRFLGRNK
jgi:hypothetical protein